MNKRRYHVIRYVGTQDYYVVYVTSMVNYEISHGDLSHPEVKLIKVFDGLGEAINFKNVMIML